jgi:hypothetical protein
MNAAMLTESFTVFHKMRTDHVLFNWVKRCQDTSTEVLWQNDNMPLIVQLGWKLWKYPRKIMTFHLLFSQKKPCRVRPCQLLFDLDKRSHAAVAWQMTWTDCFWSFSHQPYLQWVD